MPTIASLLRARVDDDHLALVFEDVRLSYREYVAFCAQRAAWLSSLRREGIPFHIGVLLDNVPEYLFLLGGAALAGATVVGINPTRRGAELGQDIGHTDCQVVVTEARQVELLQGLGADVLVVDEPPWEKTLAPFAGAPVPDADWPNDIQFLLLFTSGTTGAPKAVRMSQGRLAYAGGRVAEIMSIARDDICYQPMPLFHSNALITGWTPPLKTGATMVLRRKFSASGFVEDLRQHRATYCNYVGKALAYVLATPASPDDASLPLRRAFGNEAAPIDIERFKERFGCEVFDGYGSTEGGVAITRTDDTPPGALGVATVGTAAILDPATGEERPRARFDADGRLLNAEEAIGEIVNTQNTGGFEGYYKNEEATALRSRQGWYWTGDLGYRDEDGFFWFAGRDTDWLRVDGENFAAAPIERIMARHPDIATVVVYPVPDALTGDQVMAAVLLRTGAVFDADAFGAFLAAQADLSPTWLPRYLRLVSSLPSTETQKPLKRELRREYWAVDDPVFRRLTKEPVYGLMTDPDVEALRAEFAARGRESVLGV